MTEEFVPLSMWCSSRDPARPSSGLRWLRVVNAAGPVGRQAVPTTAREGDAAAGRVAAHGQVAVAGRTDNLQPHLEARQGGTLAFLGAVESGSGVRRGPRDALSVKEDPKCQQSIPCRSAALPSARARLDMRTVYSMQAISLTSHYNQQG